jgi:hypothetical protein
MVAWAVLLWSGGVIQVYFTVSIHRKIIFHHLLCLPVRFNLSEPQSPLDGPIQLQPQARLQPYSLESQAATQPPTGEKRRA